MKTLFSTLASAIALTLFLALVLCAAYPVAVWGIAQGAFPEKANGSLLRDKDGAVRGSTLLAQPFADARYFHPRPSAAGAGYDAASSGGTNLGPTSAKLASDIKAFVAAYRTENGLKDADPVPADAVTRSGSGLDPHISLRNARLQAARIAKARGLPEEAVLAIVRKLAERPDLGFFGEERLNVLLANLELDRGPSVHAHSP